MAFTLLNALNAFVAVARRLSFAAAARDLGVSTSALSQSVRQLETRLGVPLLTRTSRSVALTDAGARLLEKAGPGVDQALESLNVVKAGGGEVTGRIRLTVPTVSVPMVLARLLPRFLERHPEVELDVQIDDRLVDPVASRFDAGIRLVESIERAWFTFASPARPASWWWPRRLTCGVAERRRRPRTSPSTPA